jgi:hypothetical protein
VKRELLKLNIPGIWWKEPSGLLRWWSLSRGSEVLKRKKRKKEKSDFITPDWKHPLEEVKFSKSQCQVNLAQMCIKYRLKDFVIQLIPLN